MTKNILITGSTDGIGKLAALNLAKAGHHVYLHGRDADKLDSVIVEVKAVATGTAVDYIDGFVADFSDLNAVRDMAAEVNKKLSKLDVLINNAGGGPPADAATASPRFTESIIRLNLLAPLLMSQLTYEALRASRGSIINIASVSAIRSSPGTMAYGAAKRAF